MFKPLLASAIEDTSKLKYPLLASPKLDGIRATVQDGGLFSRSLKPIRNKQVQQMFSHLPSGTDGEFIFGDPTAKDCYRNTDSIVMAHGKPATGINYYLFDMFDFGKGKTFVERFSGLQITIIGEPNVVIVPHTWINTETELLEFEESALNLGHEGIMVRDPNGLYKQGRSSLKQGILLKLKRFVDAEAEIVGSFELMHNDNEATKNELGRTARSKAQAGLVGTGTLGGFIVRDTKTGVEFEVGTGFDQETREEFWKARNKMKGSLIKYKYFPVGIKDKPRHPVFLGMRDKDDL